MQNLTIFDTPGATIFPFPGKKIRPIHPVIHEKPYSTALSAFYLCINHATASSRTIQFDKLEFKIGYAINGTGFIVG